MSQHEDKQILAEYEQGLEPLIELGLETALKIIKEAGFVVGYGTHKTLTHPDYEGAVTCQNDQDVINMAVGLVEGEQAMKETLQDLPDDEAAWLAKEAKW